MSFACEGLTGSKSLSSSSSMMFNFSSSDKSMIFVLGDALTSDLVDTLSFPEVNVLCDRALLEVTVLKEDETGGGVLGKEQDEVLRPRLGRLD